MTREELLARPNTVQNDPTKIKEEPEFRVLLYPPEAIPLNDADSFCTTDVVAALLHPNASDCVRMDDFGLQHDYMSKDMREYLQSGNWNALLSAEELAKLIRDEALREILPGVSHWSQDWREQSEFDSIVNLEYLELSTELREGVSVAASVERALQSGDGILRGFALRPIKVRRNCAMVDDPAAPSPLSADFGRGAPTGNPYYKPLRWTVKAPTTVPPDAREGSLLARLRGWETVREFGSQVTAIAFTRPVAGQSASAETEDKLRPCQGLEAHFTWLSALGSGPDSAAVRLCWGSETYSVVFRQGAKPAIQKKGRNAEGKAAWFTWRTLEGAPVVDFHDPTQSRVRFRVRIICGRMCIDCQIGTATTRAVVLDARSTGISQGRSLAKWQLQRAKWPRGTLRVNSFGVGFKLEASLLQYSVDPDRDFMKLTPEGQALATKVGFKAPAPTQQQIAGWGAFSRFVYHPFAFPSDADTIEWRYATSGYKPTANCVFIPEPVFIGTDSFGTGETNRHAGFYYAVGLRACNEGTESPLITSAIIAVGASWTQVDTEPIDVSSCLISASESSAEPGVTGSADWNIELDPDLLDLQFGSLPNYQDGSNENQVVPGWKRFVRRRNPVEFAVRWRYTDETYSDWTTRLSGYIHGLSENASAAGVRALSFSARDPLLRMTKPAAMIDHRFVPLDLPFAEKQGAPLYSVEGVYEILRVAVGVEEANRLNGNTTGEKPALPVMKRFLAPGHPALLSGVSDAGGMLPLEWAAGGSVPQANGPMFAPPWNQDALSWATQFAERDFCLLFYGFPTAQGGVSAGGSGEARPVPIYGHYYTLLRDRPLWIVTDACRLPGDENFVLRALEGADVPDWQINEVLVWAMAEGAATLPFPSVIQGGAELEGDDPESAQRSWRRTMILQETRMFLPTAAESLSGNLMAMFAGKRIRRARFSFAGEARMGWGDKIASLFADTDLGNGGINLDRPYSPTSLGLGNEEFRVVRLNNSYKDVAAGVEGFQTQASCAPYNPRYEGSS